MKRQSEGRDAPAAREAPHSLMRDDRGGADWGWLLAVWLLSIVYMSFFVFRGWIPVDEGLLAQTAERVLAGELPHRDFDDCYTGGLAILYAAAFKVLGIKLTSIRIVFFFVAAMMVPPTFSLARRAVPPAAAALCTLVCVAWSVPNYFAGMPSWYVLGLSIAGVWTLFRHFDSGGGLWLVLAGLCGGLAVVVKITGLYFVAAAVLALVYHEQNQSRENCVAGSGRSPIMLVLVAILAAGFVACVLLLLRRMWRPMEFVYFVLPAIAISAVLISHEWNIAQGAGWKRLKCWASGFALFGIGMAAPIVCLLMPYLSRGGLIDLYRGLFVLPAQRFEFGALAMPGLLTLAPVLLWVVPLVLTWRRAHGPATKTAAAVRWSVCIVTGSAVLLACRSQLVYGIIWCSMLNAVPVMTMAGCTVLLVTHRQPGGDYRRLEQLFLLVLVSLLISLQQFPFALAIYFCYGAPLLILAASHFFAVLPKHGQLMGLCLGAFYLAFGVLWMNPAFNVGFAGGYRPDSREMTLPRSGLRVPQSDAQQYEAIVKLIQQNSPPGSPILAIPDCPQVYFLAGRQNPTRRLYDFLTEASGHGNDILDVLDEQAIPVVVIYLAPSHSPPVAPGLLQQIQRRYPARQRVNDFVVFWKPVRDPRAAGATEASAARSLGSRD